MDTSLRLSEKTALITSGCSSLGRVMALRLSELGVHVAIVDGPSKGGERLADEIMNLREVHDKRGKAAYFNATFADSKLMLDSVGRAAESFGGLDILIDTQMLDSAATFPLMLTQKACEIFKIRKKGRIIFLAQYMQLARIDKDGPSFDDMLEYSKSVARQFNQEQVTVNCVAVGPTEEYLLKKVPGAKSIQAAHQELFKATPNIKNLDPT